MEIFSKLLIIYLIGGILGFIIEIFYRRFFSVKKWINPGFLTGPIQPLYGFGVLLLYLISLLNINFRVKLILIAFLLTLLEYLTGLIFLKLLKIKLWDYSNRKYNISGIITPMFSLYWLILGSVYLFLINPLLLQVLDDINYNGVLYFLLGNITMIHFIDFINSLGIVTKLKILVKEYNESINYHEYKLYIKEKLKDSLIKPLNRAKIKYENIKEYFKNKEK